MNIAKLYDIYLADTEKRLKRNSYLSNANNIKIHIKPLIGTRTAAKLTIADGMKMQDDITAGKTAKNRIGKCEHSTGEGAAASHTMVILGSVLEFER